VVPPLLELDGEPVVGLLDALDADLSREGMAARPDRQDLLGGAGLDAPVRQRQVGEGVRREQPVRRRARLQEPDQVSDGRCRLRPVRRCLDACAPAESRFFSTTAMVASRSADGLNSTIDVPAVTSGKCPGGA
jgi:hypothetical protein